MTKKKIHNKVGFKHENRQLEIKIKTIIFAGPTYPNKLDFNMKCFCEN